MAYLYPYQPCPYFYLEAYVLQEFMQIEQGFNPRLEIVFKRMNFDESRRDPFVTHVLQMADESTNSADS